MGNVMICVVLVVYAVRSQAQTSDEWLEQNSTRKQYQEQQIAELQVYTTVLQQGYSIMETGLDTIGGMKSAEYDLHNSYYTSLRTVSPVVSGMPEVKEIVSLQGAMVSVISTALARYNGSPGLQSGELAYLTALYGALEKDGSADVTLLENVLTDGTLEMSDDERMRNVRAVDSRMRQRYVLTIDATKAANAIVVQRTGQSSDAGTVSQLYGLP